MKVYLVEFTTTVTVAAEDEDEAVEKAIKEISNEGKIEVNECDIFCNGRNYN